jgi:DNA-binding NtrC family response regulator
MALYTEIDRRFANKRPRPASVEKSESLLRAGHGLFETDVTDISQAVTRIDALRALILLFLREVDTLKKVVGPRNGKKSGAFKLESEVEAYEASLIRDALSKVRGNQRHAAKLLGIKPTTLHAKMKRLGIRVGKESVPNLE